LFLVLLEIILRAATILDVPYEWQANAQMANNTGLSSKEIDAAGSDGPVTGVTARAPIVPPGLSFPSVRAGARDPRNDEGPPR
jgi:hypothetical protein